jgi:hypothetical protein
VETGQDRAKRLVLPPGHPNSRIKSDLSWGSGPFTGSPSVPHAGPHISQSRAAFEWAAAILAKRLRSSGDPRFQDSLVLRWAGFSGRGGGHCAGRFPGGESKVLGSRFGPRDPSRCVGLVLVLMLVVFPASDQFRDTFGKQTFAIAGNQYFVHSVSLS